MSERGGVKLLNAALDQHEDHIVLRGALDPLTMRFLQVDDYQREAHPVTALAKIMRGFEAGSAVPDIELGMRGNRKTVRDGIYTLMDDVYIIDGQQRVNAARMFIERGKTPHLGATVHFGTTREWERNQFKILNADRTRVSSDVILRNFREDYEGVQLLFDMTHKDTSFVLKDRICWNQRQSKDHFLRATTFAKVVIVMHSHLSGFSSISSNAENLCGRIKLVTEKVGKNILRANIRTYYEILDECWGIKKIVLTDRATFIKATFMLTLARVLSNHEVFWRENRLFVDVELRKKLASFPLEDHTIISMASAGSKIDPALYYLFVEHFNKGKRVRRLKERHAVEPMESDEAEGAEEPAAETANQS